MGGGMKGSTGPDLNSKPLGSWPKCVIEHLNIVRHLQMWELNQHDVDGWSNWVNHIKTLQHRQLGGVMHTLIKVIARDTQLPYKNIGGVQTEEALATPILWPTLKDLTCSWRTVFSFELGRAHLHAPVQNWKPWFITYVAYTGRLNVFVKFNTAA